MAAFPSSDCFSTSPRLNNVFKCPQCHLSFASYVEGMGHINDAHKPYPKLYKCNYGTCTSSFARKFQLENHLKEHNERREYDFKTGSASFENLPSDKPSSASPDAKAHTTQEFKDHLYNTWNETDIRNPLDNCLVTEQFNLVSPPKKRKRDMPQSLPKSRFGRVDQIDCNILILNALKVSFSELCLNMDKHLFKNMMTIEPSTVSKKKGFRNLCENTRNMGIALMEDTDEPDTAFFSNTNIFSSPSSLEKTKHFQSSMNAKQSRGKERPGFTRSAWDDFHPSKQINNSQFLILYLLEQIMILTLLKKILKFLRWLVQQFFMIALILIFTYTSVEEEPGGMTQLGFLIPVSLAVLWGVCWMFVIYSETYRSDTNLHIEDPETIEPWKLEKRFEFKNSDSDILSTAGIFRPEVLNMPCEITERPVHTLDVAPSTELHYFQNFVLCDPCLEPATPIFNLAPGNVGMVIEETMQILDEHMNGWNATDSHLFSICHDNQDFSSYASSASSSSPNSVLQPKPETNHRCQDCGSEFKERKALNRHRHEAHAEKTRRYTCNVCKKGFKRRYRLRDHCLEEHDKKVVIVSDGYELDLLPTQDCL